MYEALWHLLPGPWWVRVIILLVAAAVILTACVYWIFPFLQPYVSPPPPATVTK